MTGTGNEDSSQSSSLIKTEEIIILTIIFSLWIGIIILFFKQWGKIRLLEPYHPSYEAAEDCEPGVFVSAPGTTSPLARLNSTKVMRTGGQLTTPNYGNLITKNKWKKVNTLVHVMAPNTSISVASVPSISTTTNPIGTNSTTIRNNEARISSPTFGQKIVTRKDSSAINIEMNQINPVESFVKGLENGKEKDGKDSREGKSSRIEQKKNSVEEDHSKGGKQDEKNREERRKAWKELKGKKEETHVNMLGSEEDEEKEERRERKEGRGRKDEGFITSSVSCTNLLSDPSYCFQRKRNCSSCMERVRSRTSIDTNMDVSSGKNRIECNQSKDMSEINPEKINPEKINPVEINDFKKKESDPESINQCQGMELKPLRVFHVQYKVNENGKKKDSEDKGEKKDGQDHHKNNDQGLNCSTTRNRAGEEGRGEERGEGKEGEKEDNSHPLNLV